VCLFHTGCAKTVHFTCEVCDKRFTRKDHLNRHRKIHTGANLYSCTQCQKRFSSPSAIRHHMNIHGGKYKCTECGKCCHSSHQYDVSLHCKHAKFIRGHVAPNYQAIANISEAV